MAKDKYDYFGAFCEQTKFAVAEANLLVDAMTSFSPDDDLRDLLARAHEIEHQGDIVCHKTFDYVATDFITPFERDDILDLTQSLDGVIDSIEDVVQSFLMFNVSKMPDAAIELAGVVQKSCVALQEAAEEFSNYKKASRLHELIVAVNDLEEEGDRLYIKNMHHLFSIEGADPIEVFVWSTLLARLEKCTDACEHASDVMNAVILKNS